VTKIIECATAREFIEQLRPSHPQWLENGSRRIPWIFRGQKDSEWSLRPSAWREEASEMPLFQSLRKNASEHEAGRLGLRCEWEESTEHVESWRAKGHVDDYIAHKTFEHFVVRDFCQMVNELGFPLNEGFVDPVCNLNPFAAMMSPYRGRKPFHVIMAMAQHHGLPTRLLDWSTNPLKAAFFCVDELIPRPEKKIAVFALHEDAFQDRNILPFEVERSFIGHLHAQQGLFTYSTSADISYIQNGEWPRVDDIVSPKWLMKIVLPQSEAEEVSRLLFVERISAAHLKPSLDSIKNTLHSHWASVVKGTL